MKIRPIPFSDELFYWLRMGKQPTVVDVHCTLTERVVPRALKAALGDALRVHTNFRIRPVVVGNMFRAAVCDVKNPPLFKADGSWTGRSIHTAFPMPEKSVSGMRSILMSPP